MCPKRYAKISLFKTSATPQRTKSERSVKTNKREDHRFSKPKLRKLHYILLHMKLAYRVRDVYDVYAMTDCNSFVRLWYCMYDKVTTTFFKTQYISDRYLSSMYLQCTIEAL